MRFWKATSNPFRYFILTRPRLNASVCPLFTKKSLSAASSGAECLAQFEVTRAGWEGKKGETLEAAPRG